MQSLVSYRQFFRVMSLLVLISLSSTIIASEPLGVDDVQQATADAKNDATLNTSMLAWGLGGVACGCFAPIYAQFKTPHVPVERLVGKSATYISTYEQVYRSQAKRRRLQAAAIGCGIGAGLSLLLNAL